MKPSPMTTTEAGSGTVNRSTELSEQGTAPGDVPIERPVRFDLVVNLKTTKALELSMPPSLLLRADQVVD
jgi:hypothetical protein